MGRTALAYRLPPSARHIEAEIDASRIAPGLYQGSKPPEGAVLYNLGFATVVLCAYEHQPRSERFGGVEVVHAPLDDDCRRVTSDEWEIARGASRVAAVRVLENRRVLVTCAAGINRSGLVTALTLLRLMPSVTPKEAVWLVQARRVGALSNPYLVDAVLAVKRRP